MGRESSISQLALLENKQDSETSAQISSKPKIDFQKQDTNRYMSEKGEDPAHALENERQGVHDTGRDGSVQSSELPSFAQLMDSVKGSMPELKVNLQQKADTCRSGL